MKKKKIIQSLLFALFFQMAFNGVINAQHSPLVPFKGKIGKTIEETEQWWPERVKAPANAPNVIWILLDDVGFGASSAFGGLIETPTFDYLADNGLRYTNFHTTGICSPTRASLLTGRNAHSVGMGHHAELGIGAPGYSGDIPLEAGTIAEIFRENGYNTFALGKWHGNRTIDLTAAGPFNRYPTGRGFDQFYGFLGGATDQWHPDLVEGVTPIDIEPNNKSLNELLSDKAINYIANQKSADAEKPFFLYLAPGAVHAPHQVSGEWIAKYKGKFDKGWDVYREEVFERQKALNLLPAHVKLPARQEGIKAWKALSAKEQKVYARFFEVYAGFLSQTDYEIGRIVHYLKDIDQLDNTLIFLIIGDNGGSKEGSYTGTTGGSKSAKGHPIDYLFERLDLIGTEATYPNYPLGWSQAINTPFRYWKSDANSEGGTHNPLIVFYPKGIQEKGGIRSQYTHVTDVLPTAVEIAKVGVPDTINGYPQLPLHGVSFAYTISNSSAPAKHNLQYYEIHGGRAIYHDGWKAAVYHPRALFGSEENDPHFKPRPYTQDKWELYNLAEDWNETNDLAAKYPEKLNELKALFDQEAQKYQVYPLRDYRAGVPAPVVKSKVTIYEHTTARTKVATGKGDVAISAYVHIKDVNSNGVIFSSGGFNRGGLSLFIEKGNLLLAIYDGDKEQIIDPGTGALSGDNLIRLEFSGEDQLTVLNNGKVVATQKTAPRGSFLNAISSDGIAISSDQTVPVTKRYKAPFRFTGGTVKKIVVEQNP
ncbi:MAG: arylsulfatase [Niabella sp.]